MDSNLLAKLTDNQIYLGYSLEELKVLEQYHDSIAAPTPGFYTDYFGIKTRLSYFLTEQTAHDKAVGQLPFPDDTLHAEAIEYIAAAKALESSRDSFTAVELGAGYAPWLVFAGRLALRKGMRRIQLLAVEADVDRHTCICSHFNDNGLPPPGGTRSIGKSLVTTELIHGAIAAKDGRINFGKSGMLDWGGAAMERASSVDYRGSEVTTTTVPAYTIKNVLSGVQCVDFLHIDIQGLEYEAIRASMHTLQRKVRYMVVATHSRRIEGDLLDMLRAKGWSLTHEKPCKFRPRRDVTDLAGMTLLDGTQAWVNATAPPIPETSQTSSACLKEANTPATTVSGLVSWRPAALLRKMKLLLR